MPILINIRPNKYSELIERFTVFPLYEYDFRYMYAPTHYYTILIPLNDVGLYHNGIHYTKTILQNISLKPGTLFIPAKSLVAGFRIYPYGIWSFFKSEKLTSFNSTYPVENITSLFKSLEGKYTNAEPSEIVKQMYQILNNLYNTKHDLKTIILEHFYRYIVNMEGEVSVENFCQLYNINYNRLYRIFKETIGLSPKRFKRLIKFRLSVEAIVYSNNKLNQIAVDSGYYDQAHFIKEFQNFVGMTPSDYITYLKSDVHFNHTDLTNFAKIK